MSIEGLFMEPAEPWWFNKQNNSKPCQHSKEKSNTDDMIEQHC